MQHRWYCQMLDCALAGFKTASIHCGRLSSGPIWLSMGCTCGEKRGCALQRRPSDDDGNEHRRVGEKKTKTRSHIESNCARKQIYAYICESAINKSANGEHLQQIPHSRMQIIRFKKTCSCLFGSYLNKRILTRNQDSQKWTVLIKIPSSTHLTLNNPSYNLPPYSTQSWSNKFLLLYTHFTTAQHVCSNPYFSHTIHQQRQANLYKQGGNLCVNGCEPCM